MPCQTLRDCFVGTESIKVRIGKDALFYPNVVVNCPEPAHDADIAPNPVIIAEVLSDSTASIDRGRKRFRCQTLSSLRHYLLVAQDAVRVEVYDRDGANWRYRIVQGRRASVALDAVSASLAMADIYERTEIGGRRRRSDAKPEPRRQPLNRSGTKLRSPPRRCTNSSTDFFLRSWASLIFLADVGRARDLFLIDLQDDGAGAQALLRRLAALLDVGHHHALDVALELELLPQVRRQPAQRHAERIDRLAGGRLVGLQRGFLLALLELAQLDAELLGLALAQHGDVDRLADRRLRHLARQARISLMSLPSKVVMTSPASIPALAAGLPRRRRRPRHPWSP